MEKSFDPIKYDINALGEKQLAELIAYHNRCYWEKNATEISDGQYDELLRRLQSLNPDHALVHAVNAPAVTGTGKVVHSEPMLSLDKAYTLSEVIEWAGKYARSEDELFIIQPKYDGISAKYEGGVLSTRGDGLEGENISDKLPLIELETIGYQGPPDRPVRGEIVIRNDDFKNLYRHIVKKDGGAYKNSRNAVAGIMGLKEISDMRRQGAKLTLVDYEMISLTATLRDFTAHWHEFIEKIEAIPYPTDGIVIKLADTAYSASLGNTAHHPRGQLAFKFSGIRRQSCLLDVQWSFGKNCLTPVAEIEPVDIGGITIRHASLHNVQNIIDRDIRIGDTVTVERAGDVIPYIVDAEPGKNRRDCLLELCPSCRSKLIQDGPELRCVNPDCFETNLQRLCAAVKNIGIERLGEPNIRRMMLHLGVKSLKNIFNLTIIDIKKLEGFQEKSAANLFREIRNARKVADYQLLAALNIPNIGINIAKMLLSKYSLEELRKLSVEELARINGIGPERAAAINGELRRQSDTLGELLACVEVTHSATQDTMPTICFTGKMPEKRGYYEELARRRGFTPVDTVTAALSLLVAADPNAAGGKLEKAAKDGIKVVSLKQWLDSPAESDANEKNQEFDFFSGQKL